MLVLVCIPSGQDGGEGQMLVCRTVGRGVARVAQSHGTGDSRIPRGGVCSAPGTAAPRGGTLGIHQGSPGSTRNRQGFLFIVVAVVTVHCSLSSFIVVPWFLVL